MVAAIERSAFTWQVRHSSGVVTWVLWIAIGCVTAAQAKRERAAPHAALSQRHENVSKQRGLFVIKGKTAKVYIALIASLGAGITLRSLSEGGGSARTRDGGHILKPFISCSFCELMVAAAPSRAAHLAPCAARSVGRVLQRSMHLHRLCHWNSRIVLAMRNSRRTRRCDVLQRRVIPVGLQWSVFCHRSLPARSRSRACPTVVQRNPVRHSGSEMRPEAIGKRDQLVDEVATRAQPHTSSDRIRDTIASRDQRPRGRRGDCSE